MSRIGKPIQKAGSGSTKKTFKGTTKKSRATRSSGGGSRKGGVKSRRQKEK